MTSTGNSSHVGSALSIVDILTVLYCRVLKFDIKKPKDPNRDRFILSKGHAGAAVYATLAEVGFFDKKLLKDHYSNGSIFSGHVSHKGVPGVELSTGSLGHGLNVGAGMAMAGKLRGANYKTCVLLSDGECDEGSNWEAILFSAHHKLNNLCLIIDYNKLQSFTSIKNTLNIEPFKQKLDAFGWYTKIVDAHDHNKLNSVFTNVSKVKDKPICIIANSIKGKGVSFMEDKVLWHYKSLELNQYKKALSEI